MNTLIKILLLWSVLLPLTGCGDTNSGEIPTVTKATLNCNSVAKGYDTSCALMLTAPIGTEYTATVTSDDDWCTLTNERLTSVTATMTATESMMWVKFSQNMEEIRYAHITVEFDNGCKFELPLRQTVFDAPSTYDKPWNELPKYKADDNYVYYTHTALLQNETKRNYTFCFDKRLHASLWVAYPLHTCYTAGDGDRSGSNFGYDPNITADWQANLSRSYTGAYDRGHQIPAADRKCTQTMMNQTFYATNMTPQQSKFNQKLWGNLEGKVRNQICADTLYVVTGAYFGGPYNSTILESTTDASSRTMPIPSHYFKVLLRTVSGNTGRSVDSFERASDLMAIGVWLTHSNTGDSTTLPSDAFVPVKTIEDKIGFEFFNMLDPNIAEAVKRQCNPSAWKGLQ